VNIEQAVEKADRTQDSVALLSGDLSEQEVIAVTATTL